MVLTRIQFDVLTAIISNSCVSSIIELTKITGYPEEEIIKALSSLESLSFLSGFQLTDMGESVLDSYSVKRAIFFAAGTGNRLKPITINTPKPLVRVNGYRIIDRLLDACLSIGIKEIYIVRGYLGEQFDQLLYKYPMLKLLDNEAYNTANNISSALVVKNLLSNAYVFESDLLIHNPSIIKKYHYSSNFLAIKNDSCNDWCFKVDNDRKIVEQLECGTGPDIWQMVGISYWNKEAGCLLSKDLENTYTTKGGKDLFWEQVPLTYCNNHYGVEIQECRKEDIEEIDTFDELRRIDKSYAI